MYIHRLFLMMTFLLGSINALEIESTNSARPTVNIAIVSDSNSIQYKLLTDIVKDEIKSLLREDYKVVFINRKGFVGDLTKKSVELGLQLALTDKKIDIIVTVGFISSQLVKDHTGEFPKPVFATGVIDIQMQGFPFTDGASGVNNFNYVKFPTNITRDLTVWSDILPFKNVVFLVDDVFVQTVPEIYTLADKTGEELGLNITILPTEDNARDIFRNLPLDTDLVYLTPLTRFSKDELNKLAEGLIDLDIPTFSQFGNEQIEAGILASISPQSDLNRLARKIAINVQKTMAGANPGQLPVLIQADEQLIINLSTLKRLNLSISWEILRNAELVEQDVYQEKVGLSDAVQQGLAYNVDLSAAERDVYISLEELNLARSALFPRVELSTRWLGIDKPRATVSLGLEPQKRWNGTAGVRQMIYSNERLGNVLVNKHLLRSNCEEFQSRKVDLVFEVARTYLNILRAKTVERIQRNNLRLTRSNLRVAQQRVKVGQATRSEIYRWESQLAQNRSNMVTASFDVKEVTVVINRLLNRPMFETFFPESPEQQKGIFIFTPEWFDQNIKSQRDLNRFMYYTTQKGLRLSPQIATAEEAIYAQAEVLNIRKRAFFAPEVFLDAELRDRWWEDGAGTSGIAHTGGKDWFVAVEARFPLYTGGEKTAQKKKAWQELKQLCYQWEAVKQNVERDIRSSLLQASSTHNAYIDARLAAETAVKNLDLVKQAYLKGSTTIIDLLDAQNQTLVSELLATNAMYDYLIDMLSFQQSLGQYDFLMGNSQREEWKQELRNVLRK